MVTLESLVKDIGASSAAIMTANLTKRHLYCYDSYNMPVEWTKIKNPFDNYTAYGNVHVYKTGTHIIKNDYKAEFHKYYIEAVMIIPIKRGNRTIGTLELIHRRKKKAFSESDLQKAEEFAKKIEIKLP
jgi:transcriptional regulator with GAF, ATPase, and Fis domain